MNDIEVLHDAVFELPAGFTVEQYIDKNVGVWINRREPFTVRVLEPAELAQSVREEIERMQEMYEGEGSGTGRDSRNEEAV